VRLLAGEGPPCTVFEIADRASARSDSTSRQSPIQVSRSAEGSVRSLPSSLTQARAGSLNQVSSFPGRASRSEVGAPASRPFLAIRSSRSQMRAFARRRPLRFAQLSRVLAVAAASPRRTQPRSASADSMRELS